MQQSHIIAVIAISALCLFGLSSAQVQLQGACPSNIEVVPNFNVEKYLGTWYEYAKYPVSFEADGSCITAKYTLTEDGDVDVINSMKYKNKYTVNIVGYAKPVSNAKLMVTFPTSPVPNVSSNYWVLDTDYDNYSVVYSCEPDNDDSHSIHMSANQMQCATMCSNNGVCYVRVRLIQIVATCLYVSGKFGCSDDTRVQEAALQHQ